jgi:hypothetical protein
MIVVSVQKFLNDILIAGGVIYSASATGLGA